MLRSGLRLRGEGRFACASRSAGVGHGEPRHAAIPDTSLHAPRHAAAARGIRSERAACLLHASRGIRLTEAGRRTYAHCGELFALLGRLDDALCELREVQGSELRLAVAGG